MNQEPIAPTSSATKQHYHWMRGAFGKRSLIAMVIVFLLGAVANLLLGLHIQSLDDPREGYSASQVWNPNDAQARIWPLNTPTQWPAPTDAQGFQSFGFRLTDVRTIKDSQPLFTMTVRQYGWPLPVLYRADMWWPWDDPQYKTDTRPDTGLRIDWIGFFINPLLVTGSFALIGLVLPAAFMSVRQAMHRWWRMRHGCCAQCGYDLTGNTTGRCPECGSCGEHFAQRDRREIRG